METPLELLRSHGALGTVWTACSRNGDAARCDRGLSKKCERNVTPFGIDSELVYAMLLVY